MIRMIVSLPEREKKWLERAGRSQGVSAAELVRRAVGRLRNVEQASEFRHAVRSCAGTWKSARGDSQKRVDALRREWDGRR